MVIFGQTFDGASRHDSAFELEGKMATPLVSIITPCYRQAHFLPEALDSIFGQTYQAIEPIVINDGSDDDTEAVIERYRNRIRYIAQVNKGLPAARNAALSVATGKYLFCLDADDSIHPKALQWLVEAAQDREDVLCVQGTMFFQGDSEYLAVRMPPSPEVADRRMLEGCLCPPHGFLVPRKMVVSAGGFDVNLKCCEDWDMWLRLHFNGAKIISVPKIGAYYRQHPQSMSRNLALVWENRCEMYRRSISRLEQNPCFANRLGISSSEMIKALRRLIAEEWLDAAYTIANVGNMPNLSDITSAVWRSEGQRFEPSRAL